MTIHETFPDAIRVFRCVCVAMVSAMVSRPPSRYAGSEAGFDDKGNNLPDPSTAPAPVNARNILRGVVAEYEVCAHSLM